MNERIKQLMDEAVKFRLDPDSNSYEAQVSPEDLEVFAELIVQDCIDKVDIKNELVSEVVFQTLELAKRRIRQHFGVEQ